MLQGVFTWEYRGVYSVLDVIENPNGFFVEFCSTNKNWDAKLKRNQR